MRWRILRLLWQPRTIWWNRYRCCWTLWRIQWRTTIIAKRLTRDRRHTTLWADSGTHRRDCWCRLRYGCRHWRRYRRRHRRRHRRLCHRDKRSTALVAVTRRCWIINTTLRAVRHVTLLSITARPCAKPSNHTAQPRTSQSTNWSLYDIPHVRVAPEMYRSTEKARPATQLHRAPVPNN